LCIKYPPSNCCAFLIANIYNPIPLFFPLFICHKNLSYLLHFSTQLLYQLSLQQRSLDFDLFN
jgi:hypothetical protein